MSFKTRYYLKLDDGIRRLPKAFRFDWQSKRAFRQFAGTKQKIIAAEYDGKHLVLHGYHIYFDDQGHLDRNRLNLATASQLDAFNNIKRAKRTMIPDLTVMIKAKAQISQHRWQVTDADRKAIVADLVETGRLHKSIPILR
jgi:hypothetical protein